MPYESGFKATDNLYSSEGFFKLCEDYGVPHKYQSKKFFGAHQHGGWSDYIGPDSMTYWIIEKSQGFTNVGCTEYQRVLGTYAYLILSLQASARFCIIENTVSALTAQMAFLNNFENIVNHRIRHSGRDQMLSGHSQLCIKQGQLQHGTRHVHVA